MGTGASCALARPRLGCLGGDAIRIANQTLYVRFQGMSKNEDLRHFGNGEIGLWKEGFTAKPAGAQRRSLPEGNAMQGAPGPLANGLCISLITQI
jgi:hypothetical protein